MTSCKNISTPEKKINMFYKLYKLTTNVVYNYIDISIFIPTWSEIEDGIRNQIKQQIILKVGEN